MDHSLLQELVDRGFYSPEEAQRAANKNYVTRALGVESNVDVEVQEHPVQKGRPVSHLLGRPVGHGRGRRHSLNHKHLWC
jgi:serine/threonine protein phosphatase PrpC